MTELNITKQRNFLIGGGGIINYVSCKLFLQKNSQCYNKLHPVICTNIGLYYIYIYIYIISYIIYITEQEREAVLKMFKLNFILIDFFKKNCITQYLHI